MSELQSELTNYSAGDTVTLTVWRMNNGYQSLELQVTLSEASALQNTQNSGNSGADGNSGNSGNNDNSGNDGNFGNGESNGQSGNEGGSNFSFPFGW